MKIKIKEALNARDAIRHIFEDDCDFLIQEYKIPFAVNYEKKVRSDEELPIAPYKYCCIIYVISSSLSKEISLKLGWKYHWKILDPIFKGTKRISRFETSTDLADVVSQIKKVFLEVEYSV